MPMRHMQVASNIKQGFSTSERERITAMVGWSWWDGHDRW
jgi:hypothetical protein